MPKRRCTPGWRGCSGRRARLSQISLDPFDRLLKLLDRSSFPCAADIRDLRQDIDAIGGEVVGQMIHLSRETPTGEAENDEHERDRREDSRDAAEPTLKPADRRRQDEREQHGECDRHEDGLRPIEDDNDQYTTGKYHPRFQGV